MKNILSQKVRHILRVVLEYPVVLWLRNRYPRLFAFLIYRFNTTTFTGLPLTLLVTVFMLNTMFLSQLTEEVMESDGTLILDEHFTRSLFSIRSDWLSNLLYFITHLGGRTAAFAIGGIATLIFLYRRRYIAILAFWMMAAGAGASVRYGKIFISRDRPVDVAYYQETFYSFPSGHATTAAAFYGFVGYLLYRHYNRSSSRYWIVGGTIALIILIGFSRIYLGVHFLTDVLAGFALGSMWLLIGISLMEVMSYRRALRRNNGQSVI